MNKNAQRAIQMSLNAARTARRNQVQTGIAQQRIRNNMQRTAAIEAYQAQQEQTAKAGVPKSKGGLGSAAFGAGAGAVFGGPLGAIVGGAVGWVIGKVI